MKDLIGTAVVKGVLADSTQVLAVTVEAGSALETWEALRDRHAETGLWPFLVDPEGPTILDRLPQSSESDKRQVTEQHRGAAEIFARADAFGQGEDYEVADVMAFDEDLADVLTDEPDAEQRPVGAETTTIGLIAAGFGGVEIPGLLDWNGALTMSGLEHTAVLADWRRRFGAELPTLTGDRIELHVPDPPVDVEEVKAVTLEQAGYCADILFQCWQSVSEMAEYQTNSTVWCFWWD